MEKMLNSLYDIRFLDEISSKETIIHNIHPFAKLITTIAFLIITVSFDKYDISRLIPLVFYPIVLIIIAEIPLVPVLKRLFVAAPFVIGLGIFNPLFDSNPVIVLSWIKISGGWISFISILIKCILTVLAAFILIATTGINGIALALRTIGIPKVFVIQFILTYRYISLLIEETHSMIRAYLLRSPREKGIRFSVWGSLTGQLLIRTVERAQRIYLSMCCRGFIGDYNIGSVDNIAFRDIVYLGIWILYFIFVRCVDITTILGLLITGGVK
ncbi:cobalt ECF transporter T component CbiQ [Tepidibacter thalassicus]|uniref:Cobalt/nickel transport system permease protein n=1 Tax=Tepidibacter thalassicus DSM 15285 TaxID=1123350 RepID=A0A1M5Q317_9FIRM|nr:cobalt ECF transporter T component CbiQ [Tepidibacter thalassicus]SHH08316.1 cobalt/nickel transport system permease protein [Tepidibacter thalassicus DSM 15285]